jgi:hypothetical protein
MEVDANDTLPSVGLLKKEFCVRAEGVIALP